MATAFSDTTAGKIFNFIIGREKKKHSHGDPTREVFETVVFVVVLVLMLKLFVAEAFVIPTGSMATTLLGDNVKVTCPECGHTFPESAAVGETGRVVPTSASCQNCGHYFQPTNARDWNSGDRVLVAKYEYHIRSPQRFDVPVFKYPKEPYKASEKTAMNYIKRLCGLPGETLAIYKGDLYVTNSLTYPNHLRPARAEDLWELDYTYPGDPDAVQLFIRGGFQPVRKTPTQIMTVRRLVFDLDQPPKSLTGVAKTRWHPSPDDGAGWAMGEKDFRHTGTTTGWVRYHHVEPGWKSGSAPRQPAPITDHLGYNYQPQSSPAWVPDLIVDCTAELDSPTDKVVLELTKAGDKFQAEFDNGKCRLFHISSAATDKRVSLGEYDTKITRSGRYDLRFANVDSRLTVWVDDKPLGPGIDYAPPSRESFEPTTSDIHEPARIGATGNVGISKVSLWRDVYYTPGVNQKTQNEYAVSTYYIQPGHYFCLGDNSASSADGRGWGLVPERLMLGRAVVVYWPLSRIGVIK